MQSALVGHRPAALVPVKMREDEESPQMKVVLVVMDCQPTSDSHHQDGYDIGLLTSCNTVATAGLHKSLTFVDKNEVARPGRRWQESYGLEWIQFHECYKCVKSS